MAVGRRRGSALESAILDAGWEQLKTGGYAGFTFEAVAERAKTGKAVLYRRWPDKESLLLAVLAHQQIGHTVDDADTGSLRGDVIALLRSSNWLGESVASLFSTILGAYFDETETTPAQLRARLLGDRSARMTLVIDRAIARGELSGELPSRVVTLPFDLFRHELIMNLRPASEETIVDIVDTVFLPLVGALQRPR